LGLEVHIHEDRAKKFHSIPGKLYETRAERRGGKTAGTASGEEVGSRGLGENIEQSYGDH
jgi:hypothetical protein